MRGGGLTAAVILVASLACGGGMTSGASGGQPMMSGDKAPPEGLPDRLELTLVREPREGAFTILVPSGWSVEGGMGPSGVPGSVIDLVSDGQGHYVLSNQALEMPPEWQAMSEVNRLR